MISSLIDIGRVRQYLVHADRALDVWDAVRGDAGFLGQVRRGLLPIPVDRPVEQRHPFPRRRRRTAGALAGRRVAVVASGGSGALASLVGVARVLEEALVRPVGYGVCSGSALFGIPLAAGMRADDVASATLSLMPRDYVDPDWAALLAVPLRLGRGWAGLLRGERVEAAYRRILGDVTLGDLPTPVWFPVWRVETNELCYVGSDTHPNLPAARAVRMAVALPVAVQPVPMGDGWCLDGGVIEILPARPFTGTGRADAAVVVNGFYPSGFSGEDVRGWFDRPMSLITATSQSRLMQHLELVRRTYAELCADVDVTLLEPVPYRTVQGAGLYGQFMDNRRWPEFMRAGYDAAAAVLPAVSRSAPDPVVVVHRAVGEPVLGP